MTEQVEEVKPRSSLTEDSWLHSESIVGSVEVDTSHLTKLDIASQLGSGNSLSVLTTEAEASLETWTDGVGVTIVDATSHKSSNAIVTVSIQLDTSSEGCPQSLTIANLSGHSKLGDNLTIGIHSSSQAGSEAQVTVSTKQTVAGSHSSNSSQSSCCQGVLKALVRIGGGSLEQTRWEKS